MSLSSILFLVLGPRSYLIMLHLSVSLRRVLPALQPILFPAPFSPYPPHDCTKSKHTIVQSLQRHEQLADWNLLSQQYDLGCFMWEIGMVEITRQMCYAGGWQRRDPGDKGWHT